MVQDKALELQDTEVHREMATLEALQDMERSALHMRHILGLEYILEPEEELDTPHILEREYTSEPEVEELQDILELEYSSELEEEELQDNGLHVLGVSYPDDSVESLRSEVRPQQ